MSNHAFWHGRRVLVTGHTGFKGGWLSTWLLRLGADVHGVALEPETDPSLFVQLDLGSQMNSQILDIRNLDSLRDAVFEIIPETIFHMAAQPLVRDSYRHPIETWNTNVMGTAHLLQAVTALKSPCAVVIVTTDKVYDNKEWDYPYRECDQLGGYDPYSSSKAATELLVDSWRSSFLSGTEIFLASARAGNVIGGGDWADDRIVPDMVRAKQSNKPLILRNPVATRPWQHVLDPLGGYIELARHMVETKGGFQEAWNFGPDPTSDRNVAELVQQVHRHWPCEWQIDPDPGALHEAGRLALDTAKSRNQLGWRPKLDFETTVEMTIDWYRETYAGRSARELCEDQIALYEAMA